MPAPLPNLVLLCMAALLPACASPGQARPDEDAGPPASTSLPALAEATEGLRRLEGLFTLWIDDDAGRVLLELPAPIAEGDPLARCLTVAGLRTGVGSNPLGLDRGQWGDAALIEFWRHGRRLLLRRPNLAFRAPGADAHQRLANDESFATSVLWATDVLAQDESGRCLIDCSDWLLRDAGDVAARLDAAGQGSWTLDRERSVVDTAACLAFPDNLEFEALLTFAGQQPGALLAAVTPRANALTLVQHLSLIRLPDDGYQPLDYDPRAGAFSVAYEHTTAALGSPTTRRLAARHRLQSPDDTLVYYVDRGVPEPLRGALLEGASWWAEAFAAAGHPGAFRVELLPEGVHPLDVRYNVIEWVHRASRGWSYGHAIVDPRTGEILEGHVSLGALRARQDLLLLQGLLGTSGNGSGEPTALALARLRQLAAHEVGHTLGLAHNFAGSLLGNGSVMDYPAPSLTLDEQGRIDASQAYATGVGPWDRLAIAWLYGPPAAPAPGPRAGSEAGATLAGGESGRGDSDGDAGGDDGTGLPHPQRLDALIAAATEPLPPFLSDADARPAGAAEPRASLWDTGADPLEALQRTLAVRAVGLATFDTSRLAPGRPLAELTRVFAPLYLHHRYQLQATLKLLGGVLYEHALAGDGRPGPRPVAAARQRQALAAVLAVLDPQVLDIPDRALALLVPPTPEAGRDREILPGRQQPIFDPLEAAAVAAQGVVAGLLQPQRCARLVDQHRRDAALPALDEVLGALVGRAFASPPENPRRAALARVVQRVVADDLIGLVRDTAAAEPVRAAAEAALQALLARLQAAAADPPADDDAASAAQRALLLDDLRRHLARPGETLSPRRAPAPAPPGSPIGQRRADDCGFSWNG